MEGELENFRKFKMMTCLVYVLYIGCSVCTCDENEIPKTWLLPSIEQEELSKTDPNSLDEFGWISPDYKSGDLSYPAFERISTANNITAKVVPDFYLNPYLFANKEDATGFVSNLHIM
jgi:hypothetical protein